MRSLLGHFFDRDGPYTRRGIHLHELLGGRIGTGDQHVTQENREGLVTHKILCYQHRVSQAERLFLARVTHLHHVADLPHHRRLFLFSSFFQEALERR